MSYPDGEGPKMSRGQAKKLADAILGKPEHKFRPGLDGKDPRDEHTRDDDLSDPKHQKE
jgi:hypothetical protein